MVKDNRKPHYIQVKRDYNKNMEQQKSSISLIENMLEDELFAVLATNAKNESYTSLISFATNEDATTLAFSTPIQTRKYEMIEKDGNVSLLIDNRSTNTKNINDIAALTAIGKARLPENKDEKKRWASILIDKHNYLDDFIYAESSAIILVEIFLYRYVSSFQEVFEWIPE